jgi:hypothetical protein
MLYLMVKTFLEIVIILAFFNLIMLLTLRELLSVRIPLVSINSDNQRLSIFRDLKFDAININKYNHDKN